MNLPVRVKEITCGFRETLRLTISMLLGCSNFVVCTMTCLGTSALLVELLHSVVPGLRLCILGRLGTRVLGTHGGPAIITLTALLNRASAALSAVLLSLRRQPLVVSGLRCDTSC